MTEKRFTITQDFEEHHRQIRDNGHIIMGCFVEPQAEVIVDLLNELAEKNNELQFQCNLLQEQANEFHRGARENANRVGQLEKENKELKYKYDEQSNEKMGLEEDIDRLLKENKELKTFKDKVFVLIDARIEIYKRKPFMAPVSAPMSVNFDEDADRLARLFELEQLKKELSESE